MSRRWVYMLRWILLGASLLLVAMASLTWFKAPTLTTWKLAIISDEFGHFLVALPLLVIAAVWTKAHGSFTALSVVTTLISVVAIAGFLRPTLSAREVSKALPERLAQAFGPIDVGRDALELPRMLALGGGMKVKFETLTVSGAGTVEQRQIDFYPAQSTARAPAPCVIVIHGGGWDSGDRTQLPALNHRLAHLGYAVAAISYGLAPSHVWPAQRQDVLAEVSYLKKNAATLGIDRNRLVLLGRSAGGQIATAVGYTANDPAIRGVIGLYSPHDLVFAWTYAKADDILNSFKLMRQYLGGSPKEKPDAYDQSSGYLHVNSHVPATLLIHGQLDSLVWHKQSERLDKKLTEAGVPHLFISLPWATHAFDFNPQGPGGQISAYAIEHFLAAVMR